MAATMYLTYAEYTGYGGTLDATKFADLEFGVEALIDYVTFNRLVSDTEIPTAVKRLVYYLIGLAQKKEDAMSLGGTASSDGAVIVSQTNDGVSTTYGGIKSEELVAMCGKEELSTIQKYLSGVTNEAGRKLLYRGLYPGE